MGDAVRVLSTLALKGAVHSLAGQFEVASGIRIDADFAPTLALLDRLRGAEAADVVIESSRPAALAHRGLGPTDIEPRDGRIWLRITGHGADGEQAGWVAFGDDAAVSGGLVGGTTSKPVFCGDAIADPLTGLHAALSGVESLGRGGGELVELSMAAVAATYAADDRAAETRCTAMPAPSAPASQLGADNTVVVRLLAERRLASC